MDDLVTWLRAQLDEDERAARSVAQRNLDRGGYWTVRAEPVWRRAEYEVGDQVGGLIAEVGWRDTAEHIARHDPVRVLREVEATRRIVDAHPFEQGIVGGVCGTCHGEGRTEVLWDGEDETVEHVDTELPWPCPTVRALASVYADRPGYRDEWRP